jgi:hypothetical protein
MSKHLGSWDETFEFAVLRVVHAHGAIQKYVHIQHNQGSLFSAMWTTLSVMQSLR